MNFFRHHRLPLAWMLFAFILFNGLACSIGHGLMLGRDNAVAAAGTAKAQPAQAHVHGTMPMTMDMPMPMPDDSGHPGVHDSLKQMFGDCAFAGVLTLALVFFVALGWLTRCRPAAFVLPRLWEGLPLRLALPALNPRAP